ncbi:MAG: hypothetical protein V8S89_04305 [Oscillospiraceae bacterium]
MLAALSVVFRLTSAHGGLAAGARAGILASVTCLECGFFGRRALRPSARLALLLAPGRPRVWLFALGLYGILKLPIEGIKLGASAGGLQSWLRCLALLQLVYRAACSGAAGGAARRCIWFWPPCSSSMISA